MICAGVDAILVLHVVVMVREMVIGMRKVLRCLPEIFKSGDADV